MTYQCPFSGCGRTATSPRVKNQFCNFVQYFLIRVQSLWLSVNDTSQCLRGRNTTIRLISATRLRSAGHFVTPLPAVMSSPPAAPPSRTLQETAASRQPDNTGGRKWIIHKRFCAMDFKSLTSHVMLANSRLMFCICLANCTYFADFYTNQQRKSGVVCRCQDRE